jgi:hypothetical protein
MYENDTIGANNVRRRDENVMKERILERGIEHG